MTAQPRNPQDERPPARRFSMLRLERHLLEEESASERAALERQMQEDFRIGDLVRQMGGHKSPLRWSRVRAGLASASGEGTFLAGLIALLSPTRPRLAWGGALASLLILLPLAFHFRTGEPGFRSKGQEGPEVALEVDGARLQHGQAGRVKSGDILTFAYRSVSPVYSQIWYAEDGGAPDLFDGKGDSSLYWSESGSWLHAPQRIRLEGVWKVQHVMILVSPAPVPLDRARRIVKGAEQPGSGGRLFTYTLIQQ